MVRRIPLAAIVFSAVLALGASERGRAQAPTPATDASDARALFNQGRDAYERQLFTEAEDAFLAAYAAMSPDDPRRALILQNVAQAIERQGGRDADALETWRRFEREARDVADDAVLLRASQRIRELEARERRRHEEAATPPPATITSVAAEPESTARFSPHWSGVAVAVVGSAMLVSGGAVGIVGLTSRRDVLAMCDGTACPADARDDADRLERLGRAGDVLIWPGLALAVTGTVLMFTLDARDDERTLSASCGLGGCAIGGTF